MIRGGSMEYIMQARGIVSNEVNMYPPANGQTEELSLYKILSPVGTAMETVVED